MAVMIRYHLPDRPAWTCRVCGDPYPCAARRAQLLDEFRGARIQLGIFMSLDFVDATADLTGSADRGSARPVLLVPHDDQGEFR
jgi:hypothetical protein